MGEGERRNLEITSIKIILEFFLKKEWRNGMVFGVGRCGVERGFPCSEEVRSNSMLQANRNETGERARGQKHRS